MRVDKYLKVARVIKRRVVANELCDNSKVFINGIVAKAHQDIKIGDVIKINLGNNVIEKIVEEIPYEKKK